MKKLLMILVGITFGMNVVAQDVYIPNAFSPNEDGINDIWKPIFNDTLIVEMYHLQIYDKTGVLIFTTHDYNEGWDGMPFDTTYVYRLTMKCTGCSEGITKSGTITSIK
jgi:gliding motility-associated-like protein